MEFLDKYGHLCQLWLGHVIVACRLSPCLHKSYRLLKIVNVLRLSSSHSNNISRSTTISIAIINADMSSPGCCLGSNSSLELSLATSQSSRSAK